MKEMYALKTFNGYTFISVEEANEKYEKAEFPYHENFDDDLYPVLKCEICGCVFEYDPNYDICPWCVPRGELYIYTPGKTNRGVKLLIEYILENDLNYYVFTGATAYVAEYEDGKLFVCLNGYEAEAARPGVGFEFIASAKWDEGTGNPRWTIYGEDEACACAEVSTNIKGYCGKAEEVYYF